MRGRKIFGGLEPWGKIWRGGANRNPRLVISDPITFGGTLVKAGSYTLFSKPGQKEWTVYLYDEINKYGAPEAWDETKVVATLVVDREVLPQPIETLGYHFEEISNDHFALAMEWENTRLVIPFGLETKTLMNKAIAKTLAGPNSSDYSNAAMYELRDGKNYEQALAWFDKAIELDETPSYWEHLFRAQTLVKLGRDDEARASAQRSLELAKKRNSDYGTAQSMAILEALKD
jgi:tetratricopeptide (TPR) repeat protein